MVPVTTSTAGRTRNVVLVCGPPGAGKTTHARTYGLPVYDIDDPEWSADEQRFRAALARLGRTRGAQAVVIRAGATLAARRAAAELVGATTTVVLDTDAGTCIRRVRARARPRPPVPQQVAAVRAWWRDHTNDTTDPHPQPATNW